MLQPINKYGLTKPTEGTTGVDAHYEEIDSNPYYSIVLHNSQNSSLVEEEAEKEKEREIDSNPYYSIVLHNSRNSLVVEEEAEKEKERETDVSNI